MISKYFLIPLVAVIASNAAVQSTNGVALQLRPGSELSFEGTSSLHAFHCKTTTIHASLQVDPTYMEARVSQMRPPLKAVEVVIPVRSLTCGNSGLEKNMYKAMKADAFPEIRYELTTSQVPASSATGEALSIRAVGKLTIAGREKTIDMLIKAYRLHDGNATATATQGILMTDFGIKPPVFMLGTLKTGNKVVVTFKLTAAPKALASLGVPTP
jgi:polyisoprenoid-binding protein YceI